MSPIDLKSMKERILNNKPKEVEPLSKLMKSGEEVEEKLKDNFKISSTTKLTDIFERYPFLAEKFTRIDKRLEKVMSPVFRLILPTASIFTICEKTGVSVTTMISGLKELIDEELSK